MFVRPYVRNISAALNRQISVEFHIGNFYVNCRENKNLNKTGERSKWNFISKPTYVLFLLAKLNRHTSAPFEWNFGRLLGLAKMYKHYANAPLCYTIVHCLSCFHEQLYYVEANLQLTLCFPSILCTVIFYENGLHLITSSWLLSKR